MNSKSHDSPLPKFASDNADTQIDWIIENQPIDYKFAVEKMEQLVDKIIQGVGTECVWLVEHPPLYTAGTSAKSTDLIDPLKFEVFKTGRGGQYTYHGPGQRVIYLMLDLKRRNQDVRAFIAELEEWIIRSLGKFNIKGEKREKRVGIWVQTFENGKFQENKIAAIGIRVRKWVTFHGISININPNLEHYSGIVPCGIAEHSVTSFKKLGISTDMAEVDKILRVEFEKTFGPTKLKS